MAVNTETIGKSHSQPTTPVDNHGHHHHSDELLPISRPLVHQLSLSELSTAATAGGDEMNNLNSNLNLIHEAFYSHHQAAANNNIIKHVGGSGHSAHSAGGGTGAGGGSGHRLRPSVSASDSYLCGLPSYEGKSQTSNSYPR